MLGRVTLQFIKAKRVLKSLVSLESKFQEKPWAPKYHHQLLVGYASAFFCSPWRGLVGQSPCEVPRSACRVAQRGTCQGLTFLSCRERLVTVPGTCNECQEIQTGEHQVKPLRIHLYCEQISSKGEGMWNSECWLKWSTTQYPVDGAGYFWNVINLMSILLNTISFYVWASPQPTSQRFFSL